MDTDKDRISAEAGKEAPLTKQQEENFETFFGIFLAVIVLGFFYFIYVLLFT